MDLIEERLVRRPLCRISTMPGRISLQSDPEREYDSIAAAVEAASSAGGDTVVLGAGEYNERIVMGRPIKIAASVEAAEGEVRCPSHLPHD